MLKILVKKQIKELFSAYFFDSKKKKMRSKATIALYFLLFFGIIFGIFGDFIYSLASKLDVLFTMDLDWFYFVITGMCAITFSFFLAAFLTYSSVYEAKDNDLLLSMPIPVKYILISRIISVYGMCLFYSLPITITSSIVYLKSKDFAPFICLSCLIWAFVVSVISFLLSTILGYIIAKISSLVKKKKLVNMLFSLAFICLYYFVNFRLNKIVNSIISNAIVYGNSIKDKGLTIYLFGRIACGDLDAIFGYSIACLGLLLFVYRVMTRSFGRLLVSTGKQAHIEYKEKKVAAKSQFMALLSKEFSRFASSPQYMLNCGMGVFLMPIMAVFIFIKGAKLQEALMKEGVGLPFTVMAIGVICILSTMNDMVAPSISLEGKAFWICRSLPVSPKLIIRAKLAMQLILTIIPLALVSVSSCIVFDCGFWDKFLIILIPIIYSVFNSLFDLRMAFYKPDFNWTNEIYPIKQSLSVFVSLFGGWIYVAAFIGLYSFAYQFISQLLYSALFMALTLVLILILTLWLEKVAVKRFEEL